MTLLEILSQWREYVCKKHDLNDDPEEYVKDQINNLSNYEFLQELSSAMEQLLSK